MKILLPIDGSDSAKEAVEFVRSLAKNNPVDVVVLAVCYVPPQFTVQPFALRWIEQGNQHAQMILDRAKKTLVDNCRSVSLVHETAEVIPCILEQAKKFEVDLIVIGAKGRSAINRILLGSISDSVATQATCSVVVVRPSTNPTHQPNKILIGYDKSVASREAVAELMEWNLSRDTQVDVVSVVENPYIFVGEAGLVEPIAVSAEYVQSVSETAKQMASQIAEHFPHTDSHSPISDHVGDAVVCAAEKGKADLIVVGDTGRSMLGKFFLGSTSKYVLRHAPCSVWISRHHWKSAEDKQVAKETVAAG
jgi:nucleotide-binding universal stress UspA family protein